MVKRFGRILSLALIFILVAAMLLPGAALAAGSWTEIQTEQYSAIMPYVDLYFYPTDSEGATIYGMDLSNTQVTAVLDEEFLAAETLENAKAYGAAYIFVVNISKVSSDYHFVEAVKKGLQTWVTKMGENDRMVLVAYGDDIYNVLDGDEDAVEASKRIGNMEQSLDGNLFFDAMAHAINIASTNEELPQRKIIISVESGASVAKSSAKSDETAQAAVEAGYPIYSLCNGTADASRQAMLDLTTAAGGETVYADYRTAENSLEEMHTRFDSCYILTLRAATNFVEPTNRRLAVELSYGGTSKSLSMNLKINYWYTDKDAPYAVEAEAEEDTALRVSFSENVSGADKAANYTLTHTGMNKEYSITQAEYDEASTSVLLTVSDALVQGEYSLVIEGVNDISMEANALVYTEGESFDFELKDANLAKPSFNLASVGLTGWLIIGLIVLVLAGAIVFFVIYRKRRQAEELRIAEEKRWREEQARIQQEEIERRKREEQALRQQSGTNGQRIVADRINSLPVVITIIQENGIKRSIDAVVGEKFVIGRDAKSCELAIDDRLLSRQHLRLSFRNGSLLVCDLGSTNKTYLNGVVINAERQLQPKDVILAGKTRIIVEVKLS